MEWKLIETAPVNEGVEFLAYDAIARKMDVCVAWRGPLGLTINQCQMDGEYGPLEDEFGYVSGDITHWMPLPTPPTP